MSVSSDVAGLLREVPTRPMRGRLVRCVAALGFLAETPPRFLYTSGRPNRCNPEAVSCLYFSESEEVANLEYRRGFEGTAGESQPKLTFVADVDLKHIVDLAEQEVLDLLGLSERDFFEPWRQLASPTRLQQLGLAISSQRVICAIRYPSNACHHFGTSGWNLAIFPSALARPSRVRILGEGGKPLEELP
jgi:RES domain-containing protein